MVVRERGCIHLKRGLIFPVGQSDPLQTEFIIPVERVGNQPVVQQIGLHHAWNLSRDAIP